MASIAIIGTGISGMGAAYLLHPNHAVTLYERESAIGGHTRTLTVDYDGAQIPVDTGFIVFNDRNYPHLTGMFRHLGVASHKSDMSFAITTGNGGFEWGARTLNSVFGQRSNILSPRFWRLIGEVIKFNREAPAEVARHPQATLGELIAALGLSEDFLDHYILPMGGAIWSSPELQVRDFPARTFVQFFTNHGLMAFSGQPQWYTVTGGSQEYAKRLTESFRDRICTNCGAVRVTRSNGKVRITDSTGAEAEYDHVILTSHADQSLALLADASAEEREVLGAFRYQKNEAFLHRDTRLMPKRRRCWASWVVNADASASASISVTYWMNLLQGIDHDRPLFVTLNPAAPIPAALVFDAHTFEHPVFTLEAIAAQEKVPALQGKQNTWFCGAWQRYGFHEDGLSSAVTVAKQLGATIPWA